MGLLDFFIKRKNDGPITSYGADTETDFNKSNIENFNWETTHFDSIENEYANFYLKVEDVFAITGRGTVVLGKIEAGTISVGDEVCLKRAKNGEIVKTEITGIEMFRKLLNTASVGENVGLLLRDIKRDEVERGDILYKE